MSQDQDHYAAYYADKLWNLMPAIYRFQDTDSFERNGPLRELVNRIGNQAAILRRSIDRLWDDQSIETCDDWVIPYIADLLATNLVSNLDARGQRLDVAKSIYYRRRKGTVAILEEIASDISGWDVRVVEFFRRLGRTRHNFDPAIGAATALSRQNAKTSGLGDGVKTVFNLRLKPLPIAPGTLQVELAGIPAGSDNGREVISGSGLNGTINYLSGVVTLTFATAPAANASLTLFYDYQINESRELLLEEGLLGAQTNSRIGGWADLRNINGAALGNSDQPVKLHLAGNPRMAFDEFSHTADFRHGVGQVGWHNIPRLGVFIWRLQSFGVGATTPVESSHCPGLYSFDPTGRQIPLFAASQRNYGDTWRSPAEWRLPSPLSQAILEPALSEQPAYPLYSGINPVDNKPVLHSLGIFQANNDALKLIPASQISSLPLASNNAEQAVAYGDGTLLNFKVSLPATPLVAGSLQIFLAGEMVGSDDKSGLLQGAGLSGTVDYATGDISMTFLLAPAPGTAISILYQHPAQQTAFFIVPEQGCFLSRQPPPSAMFLVTYYYGFPAKLAAGPYDRTVAGYKPLTALSPVTGGGDNLALALAELGRSAVVTIGDSLTYRSVNDVGSAAIGLSDVSIGAENTQRPLIRLPVSGTPTPSAWVFTGGADNSQPAKLLLDGLFVSGGDIVLRGNFDSVNLTFTTLDPGNSDLQAYGKAIDDRELLPCRIWVEGTVKTFSVDHSVIGPVRTRVKGEIETLLIRNSIVQAAPISPEQLIAKGDGTTKSFSITFAVTALERGSVRILVAGIQAGSEDSKGSISGSGLTSGSIDYLSGTLTLTFKTPPSVGDDIMLVYTENSLAIEMPLGVANISRCTILGKANLHRLEANESIFDDQVKVINTQDGCVRFCATALGSVLPRQYESMVIAPRAPLFTSRDFGHPAYAQLLDSVDNAILSDGKNASISSGAEDGSEIGVYANEKNPIKNNSILIKYQEYMPQGLVPVLINVT